LKKSKKSFGKKNKKKIVFVRKYAPPRWWSGGPVLEDGLEGVGGRGAERVSVVLFFNF